MRIEYIQTKVRPIKKLFVIEPSDFNSFAEIFIELQNEIDSIANLIFVNDDTLFTSENKDFVKRSDPDIIFNLSSVGDNKLANFFGVRCVKPDKNEFKIARFGTTLSSFSQMPASISKFYDTKDSIVNIVTGNNLENNEASLFACINLGLFPSEHIEYFELSIFKDLNPRKINLNQDVVNNLFENATKFSHLTNFIGGFGGAGQGTSIYEIDYNPEGFFTDIKKKYFFVSDKGNFKAITYFWNTRSYYPNSNLAWVPIGLLNELKDVVDSNSVFICFDEMSKRSIGEFYTSNTIIQPSQLFYRGRNERWTFFEHDRSVNITDEELIIQHPADKSFSDIGMGCAFILEMIGLEEFALPKRRNIGELFMPHNVYHPFFAERFLRVSEVGISKYIFDFQPLKAKDIVEKIKLPSFSLVINHLFKDIGYKIEKTTKSSILEQSINLLGGVEKLDIVSKQEIFELLIKLTPNIRTEKTVRKLLGNIETAIAPDDILGILGEIRANGGVSFPSVICTIEEILKKSNGIDPDKLMPILQELYDLGVFLRGKFFKCPKCESKIWIQIDDIERHNYCAECNNEIKLPVFSNNKQASDYYRLNQLFVRAIDQGQLATILLLNFFNLQGYRAFNYISNIEVWLSDKLLTDVDLLVKIGNKIGLCECKSNGSFNNKQVKELIDLGIKLNCDFFAFSCLNSLESEFINDLIIYLKKKDIKLPIFILGKESLFKPNPRFIKNSFKTGVGETFKTGVFKVK